MLRLYKSGRHFWRTKINKHALFISLQHSLCFLGLTQIFLIHYNLFKSKRCLSSLSKLFLPIRRKIPSIFIQVLGHLPSNLYQEPTPINFAFTYFSRWFSSQWCYCNIYITVFSHHVASSPHLRFFIIYMLFKSYFSFSDPPAQCPWDTEDSFSNWPLFLHSNKNKLRVSWFIITKK